MHENGLSYIFISHVFGQEIFSGIFAAGFLDKKLLERTFLDKKNGQKKKALFIHLLVQVFKGLSHNFSPMTAGAKGLLYHPESVLPTTISDGSSFPSLCFMYVN